jgi:hypothetical protein
MKFQHWLNSQSALIKKWECSEPATLLMLEKANYSIGLAKGTVNNSTL